MGRVAVASFIGTAIEFHDFYIYGTAAALAFSTVFVPEGMAGGRLAQLLVFAGFAVAFVARPVGGAVFGHSGDRAGRKSMLIISLLLMALATFCATPGPPSATTWAGPSPRYSRLPSS